MRYVGGKSRQAKLVREVVAERAGGRPNYLEPFVGGGSVFAVVAPLFTVAVGADVCPEVPCFWEAVRDGWVPPDTMSRETWEALRGSDDVTPLRAWAAFAGSYKGLYFSSYGAVSPGRNYLAESQRATARKAAGLTGEGVVFAHAPYDVWSVDESWVVYCDPPYAGTTSYPGAGGAFDHGAFWDVCADWSAAGALVLVHEYTAPDGWEPVLTTTRTATLSSQGGTQSRREILFARSQA